jgi:nucleoid-associated protein YgaU
MIRLVLGIFAVAGLVCALIILPPVSDWRMFQTNMAASDLIAGEVQVTRNVEPTFSETGELLNDGYAFAVDDTTVDAVAQGVVAGLQGTNVDTLTPLQVFLVQAIKAGQTDAEIASGLADAATAGTFAIPAMIATPDGRIDVLALLAAIDTTARSDIPAAEAEIPVSLDTAPVVEATPALPEAIAVSGPRFHVVEPGDSLGSISTLYFGNPRNDDLIFEANRDILSDPNDLSVGQRLVIPEQ